MGINSMITFSLAFTVIMALASFGTSQQYNTPLLLIIEGGGVGLTSAISLFFSNPLVILAGAASIALGITFFPNPWAIFFAPAAFLFGWSVYPISIFNGQNLGISDPNVALVISGIQAILLVTYTLLMLSWFKGQETIA